MQKEQIAADTIFVIHGFLASEECDRHIEQAERLGFQDAPLGGDSRAEVFKEVRDNDRVILDDPALASLLYLRAHDLLPVEWFGWPPTGFNRRWRYYRYGPGQRFAPHFDGCFSRDNGEQSQHTVLVYLNDDFEGGSTNFYTGKVRRPIQPVKGMALVFAHRQLHEGAQVDRGCKYVLRTDVMYEPFPQKR